MGAALTEADRIRLKAEADTLEFHARRIRELMDEMPPAMLAPSPTPKSQQPVRAERYVKPKKPDSEQLEAANVTPIVSAQVARDLRRRGCQ